MTMDLKAKITLAGVEYVYTTAGGRDLGDFHGPGFVHSCVMMAKPADAPALEIYDRSDKDGSRIELVFKNFKAWGPANDAAKHLPPYTVKVERDGVEVAGGWSSTQAHWWTAKWRWTTSERPIVVSPSQGMLKGFFAPYGTKGNPGRIATDENYGSYIYSGPMSGAGVTQYMPQTGGRPDIGLYPDPAANYLMNPNDSIAEMAMREWGEAAGSVPLHYCDETTEAAIDRLVHPIFSAPYLLVGNPDEVKGPSFLDFNFAPKSNWVPDFAHFPSLSYVPAIATGDSYHLENLQAFV